MKRVLLFIGSKIGKNFKIKENFAHTAQMIIALRGSKKINPELYGKKELISTDFFSKKNDLIASIGFSSFYFVLLKKLSLISCPVLHSWNDDYHKCGGVGGRWLRKKIEYWTVRNADYNLTCSKYRHYMAKKMGANIKFIPHGVMDDWNKIKPKRLKGFNLIYMGEFSSRKGSGKIINLAEKFPSLTFHFFGRACEGDEEIIKNLPKNIVFHGWVENKVALSYCKGADILLHPTDNDSTLKIYSYIKCGKIILALKGQVNYLLEHKKNAYICNNFEEGLKEILEDKKLRKKLFLNIKSYKVHYWKEIRKMYCKFIMEILDEK